MTVGLLFLAAHVALSGCATFQASTEDDVPLRYHLFETTSRRALVERAITMVDGLLGPDVDLRLRPTWTQSGFFPALTFDNDRTAARFAVRRSNDAFGVPAYRYTNSRLVPVYLIDDTDLARIENVFVPDGETCIFVNVRSLHQLFDAFGVSEDAKVHPYTSFERAAVLAAVLLHELGHIRYGDSGSYTTPAQFRISEIRDPSSAITNKEVRADRYAAEQLGAAAKSGDWALDIAPYGRAHVANDIYRALAIGYNSFDTAHDPEGFLNGHPDLAIFRTQRGYSHLNLFLRMLVMMYESAPSEDRLRTLRKLAASNIR